MRACFYVFFSCVFFSACPPSSSEGEGEGDEGEGEGGEGEEGEGEGEGEALVEQEPNDGDPVTEVNALAVGATMSGTCGGADDVDFFHVDGTVGGRFYRASAAGFDLAILDDGRGGNAPGADYVRLGNSDLELAALGGRVYVAVSCSAATAGDAYSLVVTDVTDAVTEPALTAAVDGALTSPGAIAVYPFSADAGDDVVFDLVGDDADFRLFVVSTSQGDWIARNDDRSAGDPDPLIDAPLFEEGPYLLLVENIAEDAAGLGYRLTPTLP